MKEIYVSIETGRCIGCGSCAALCAEVFAMNDHGVATIIGEVSMQNVGDVRDAVRMCPVDCIYIDE